GGIMAAGNVNEYGLTAKQENFAWAFVETGNASEAYRRAYNAENMKENTIGRRAFELVRDGKVAARVKQIQEEQRIAKRATLDDILAELEDCVLFAKEVGQAGPAVAATMGRARLLGLDKQIVDHRSGDGSMTPPKPVYKVVTE
ncbi:MAG: terminase small subunit, partial [Burkholderiaceae bacterium]